MRKLFSPNSLTTIYRRENNLKEISLPSLFPPNVNKNESYISNCNKWDICNNYLIPDNKFTWKVTGGVYSVRGSFSCSSPNVIYIISCKNCGGQYIDSATDFKARFRKQKSDFKTKKDRCGSTRHFSNKCCDSSNLTYFWKYN